MLSQLVARHVAERSMRAPTSEDLEELACHTNARRVAPVAEARHYELLKRAKKRTFEFPAEMHTVKYMLPSRAVFRFSRLGHRHGGGQLGTELDTAV